jgi:hypothetical protein
MDVNEGWRMLAALQGRVGLYMMRMGEGEGWDIYLSPSVLVFTSGDQFCYC